MDHPPEPILSDYIEMGTLVLLFLIGGPLNLAAYTQIAERPSYTRLDILKKHLNYSDLFVLFIYVPSRACWLLTYDWRGGDLLCRLVKCLHTLAFQISSNVIVCIALDRLLSVLSPSHHSPEKAHKRTRIMLWIAWVAAFIISAPQFVVWRSYLAFEEINWSQCMQIWEITRAKAYLNNNTDINYSALMQEENIYVVVHMLLIFWIPATIVVLCYLIVSCWVYFNSKPLAFNLENARNSTCGTAIMSSSRTRNGTRTTAITGSAVITDKHYATGVSYHTGIDTVETIISKPTGVHFATNPKIIINDEVMQPLTTRQPRGSTASFHMLPAAMPVISNNATYSAKLNRSYRSRAIRVSFLLVAAYIICWLPYNALSLIQFIAPDTFSKYGNQIYCLHGTIVLNSVINPFLYGLFGGKCRPKRRNR
uniref:G-protein coupled receptors family 1 profile domain-containing protein n=1 Tax=Panagrolaimus sp. JU765 TaxID=591449 RepID=A0AC34QT80_9BILA